MNTTYTRSCGAAFALGLSAAAALAGARDYRFDLISTDHRVGSGTMVELRLTDLRTGAAVEGAVIYATRMDMAPDGMDTMTTPVASLPSDRPGTYRFAADLGMAGGWRFSVAAKVQGEPETVSAEIELRAEP
jgi:hypothetical protein